MIVLKLKAGLGNQLFQYAYARSLAIKSKTTLKIDLGWFHNIKKNETPREYKLDRYNINAGVSEKVTRVSPLKNFSIKVFKKIINIISPKSDYVFYPSLSKPVKANQDKIVEGYWNTEKYFNEYEDLIKKELTLKSPLGREASEIKNTLDEKIKENKTLILIHIRRGDYATSLNALKHHGLKGLEYYKQSISIILEKVKEKEKITFILASDDVEWVKDNILTLISDYDHQIISGNKMVQDFEELYLMSLCHHFIIANSTFSWWAAWLSETATSTGHQKIVIGPKSWVSNPKIDTKDVMPEDWIRI
jgi:hypothetical protein